MKNVATQIYLCIAILTLAVSLNGQSVRLAFEENNDSFRPTFENKEKENNTIENESRSLSLSDLGIYDLSKPDGTNAVNFAPQLVSIGTDAEPNNTPATASPIAASAKVTGNLFPNGDIDYYSFTATAGSRVYAGTMTAFSAGSSTNSVLTLYGSDGTTIIETDDDNGTFAATSSSIAGAIIPTTGTYYIRVNDFTAGTTSMRPYDLWLNVQTGAPTPEVEPNDTPATANPLPASGWVRGARNPAPEQDYFSFTANAGDTVFLSLDLDPERDNVTWNGRVGIGLFGDANSQVLLADDPGTADTTPSEAMFMTVKNAGTYYAFVDSANAAVGDPTATYHLSVSVLPKTNVGINCTTYTSTNVPQTIGPANSLTSSTLTVPGNPRIASLRLLMTANHDLFQDMDVHLRSPAGNDNGVFTDIGAAAVGGQTILDSVFGDDAGITPSFYTILRGINLKPELNYRLDWFNGEDAGGVWTLDIRDDTNNTSGGTLNSWGLEICEQPALTGTIVYNQNFEGGDGGYTHSGTQDEWEYGTPVTAATTTANPVAAFTTCNSGTNCWKTDLDSTYNNSANYDLFSPQINLVSLAGTINLAWAMKYQMESASFDHFFVEVQDVNNAANNRIVWQWYGATMTDAVGNPVVNIGASAGWGRYTANISDFAGKNIKLRFHLDTDTTVVLGGVGIDDVQIRANSVTAASVNVGGRVTNTAGSGISNAVVTMTDDFGATRTTRANQFGYYNFYDVGVGNTYILNVNHKRYQFAPKVISVVEEIKNADFSAN